MDIIKTPDKVILTRGQIDKILRDHIEKETGRKVVSNCVVTNSNSVNPVSGDYKFTFELEPLLVQGFINGAALFPPVNVKEGIYYRSASDDFKIVDPDLKIGD